MVSKGIPEHFELYLSALGYLEEGRWVAHCLEMDIVGHGDDPESALKELEDLIAMQISFAISTNDFDLLYKPAPPELFVVAAEIRRQMLLGPNSKSVFADRFLTSIKRPAVRKRGFEPVHA